MRVGRRFARLAPAVAVVATVSVIAAMAVNATGQTVQRVDANNAAMWVTNNDGGLYGRFNKASSTLELLSQAGQDGVVGPVDILQDSNTVLVQNQSGGQLIPVDTAAGTDGHDQAAAMSGSAEVDLRGGTVALLDAASGKLWGMRTQGTQHMLDLSGLDPTSPPLADLGPTAGEATTLAGLSVGSDGSIHAANASGKQVTITATELGFNAPVYTQLPVSGLKSVRVAALGAQTAVFDPVTGILVLPGGKTQQLPADPNAALQQGGADVGTVAVATSTALFQVGYDGTLTELFSQGTGAPALPVNLGTSAASGYCILSAWSGSVSKVARSCNGAPATDVSGSKSEVLRDPVFRVNFGLVVLNDRATGRIYDIDLKESFNDWKDLLKLQEDQNQKDQKETTKPTDAKPKAADDAYGARPNRTSVLHVLDNDTDPNGRVLSISKVDQPRSGAKVLIAPDGQTLQFDQPKAGVDSSFAYTINNGKGVATARVTIKAENGNENQQPEPRANNTVQTYAVPSAGNVTIPVAGDYRDYDGDPITVISATDGKDDVPVTSDGQIEYTAPKGGKDAQNRLVGFKLTDGNSAAIPGTVKVKVAGTDDTTGIAPVAQADAVKGEVGKMISVMPLANDIAGVDPGDENTRLSLADDVAGWKNAKVTTDRDSGRVTFVSKQAKTYWVKYKVAFGSAPKADGMIRVDVLDKVDEKPIAMPDQAVIRGQQAITVDVLANDSDPHGGLLTVQTASPNNENQLQVAVIQGRWLRIVPVDSEFSPNPQSVTYEITNGEGVKATGSVTVTHLPALTEDAPLVRPDTATVRAGDSTLISVLANDLTLGGATLILATTVEGSAPGQLPVKDPTKNADADQGDVGTAYVVGNQVRYIAPKTVAEPIDVDIQYVAKAGRRGATGDISVTVNPEPTDANPDSPPQPTSIEGRATAGDTITIPIPASGQDPDGDSVALVGLGSGPQLGRVTRITAKGITYQAFPTDDSLGTDQFAYVVTDKYGQTGTGVLRVAVVPPGQTQTPMTVDDMVTAKPGSAVRIDAIANDLIAMNDKVTIKALANPPSGVALAGDQGPITATAPAAKAEPLTVNYTLTGNGGDSTPGTITITGQDGYVNPPQVKDQLATGDGKVATVDVLADAWDPDGDAAGLTVSGVSDPAAKIVGGVVSVAVQPTPQVLSYSVKDADGGSSAALIYVPGSGDGTPYAKGVIPLESGKNATVALSDYVVSPRDRSVRITTANTVGVSPRAHLKVKPSTDLTKVELTSDEYVGPATLNLEVTDGSSLTDPDARTAVLSIPIQVGPDTPVLRCPEEPQTITRGTTGKAMDIIGLCHVWTADPATQPTLAFSAGWDGSPLANVTPTIKGQSLVLQATGDAHPGDKVALKIEIPGSRAVPATLNVLVKDARPARYKSEQFEVKQGGAVSGRIVLDSPIEVGRQDTILSMPPVAGGTATFSGADWSVTADPTFYGPLAYQLTLSDVANVATTDRQIRGLLNISVYGRPAAPAAPTSGKIAQNHAVTLTWKTPANHGATIEKYEVQQSGGRGNGNVTPCDTNQCTISGLENDVPVTFQVRAYNKAGWSEYGPLSAEFRPDQVPSTVTGFTSSDPQNHQITLSWNRVSGDFSDVTGYEISWPGGHASAAGGATSKVVSGVANEKTTFSIWAKNRTGKSRKAAKTIGWPTGDPTAFTINDVEAATDVDQPVVRLSWTAADANGRGPVKYTVKHNSDTVCTRITAEHCTIGKIPLDGANHGFTVLAENYYTHSTSESKPWSAVGKPDDWASKPNLSTHGIDHQFTLSATAPNPRGRTGTVTLAVGGKEVDSFTVSNGDSINKTLSVAQNGVSYPVTLKLCNENKQMTCSSTTDDVTTYGPIKSFDAQPTRGDGTVAYYQISVNPNGRALDVTADGSHKATTGAGEGTWSSGELGIDLGDYDVGRDITIKVSDGTRSEQKTIHVTSGSRPQSVTLSEGAYLTASDCTYGCRKIIVSTSGLPSSYTCVIWNDYKGVSQWGTARMGGSGGDTGYYYGYWGSHVWVVCNGVESNHKAWTNG